MAEQITDQLTDPIESYDDDMLSGPLPAWPKWIGGLAIAWGALMLTCTGLISAYMAFLPRLIEPQLDGAPMPEAMKLGGLDWTLMGVGLVITLLLLFGGIFCVSRKPISRVMILIWGITSIPLSLLNYVRQIEAQESIRAWAEQYPNSPLAQQMNAGGQAGQQITEIIGLVITIILGVLIPGLFVIWFGLIKTKPEHMTGSEETII